MDTYPHAGRITLDISGVDQSLYVRRFACTEALSTLYQIDLDFVTDGEPLNFDQVIGQPALVTLEGPSPERLFHGIISRCELTGKNSSVCTYNLRVQPNAWRLGLVQNNRIFQKQHAVDIIKKILGSHRIDHTFSFSEAPKVRDYCVQTNESDWTFINRLLEEDGFYYFFRHEREKHVLVMANDPEVHSPIAGTSVVRYQPHQVTASGDEHIHSLRVSEATHPGNFTLRDYNLAKPDIDLEANTKGDADSDLEVYEFPGVYEEPKIGKSTVQVRYEEGQVGRVMGKGSSNCPRFVSGSLVEIEDYIHPLLDRGANGDNKTLLLGIAHHATQEVLEKRTEDVFLYSNSFTCMPSSVPFRPARRTPRPKMTGVQTAIVVGPSGQEIYPDDMGRVKVQFPWDRDGKHDENSSCWVPVMQRWSGPGWGTQYVPRIGQQVIIDFIDGNPDRPIIVGQVYQPLNPPPYDPSHSPTISTIKTHSSPGGGASDFNEIKFEDKKGKEELYVQAQRNKTELVKANKSITVGGSHSETIKKDTNVTVTEGNFELNVEKGKHTVKVGTADARLFVDTGARQVIVAEQYFLSAKSIEGIAASENIMLQAKTDVSVKSESTAIVLDAATDLSAVAVQKLVLEVGGSTVTLEPTKITLASGSGNIVLDSSGVTISGAIVKIN